MIEQPTDEQGPISSDSSAMPDAPNETEERDARYFEEPEVRDAVSLTSPAPPPVGAAPRFSRTVGEGDAERFFPARTPDEAERSAAAIAAYCGSCPISHKCPEEACAVYRAEATALEVIDAAQGRTAVAGVVLPAPPGARA